MLQNLKVYFYVYERLVNLACIFYFFDSRILFIFKKKNEMQNVLYLKAQGSICKTKNLGSEHA